ncbi:hypothetical protein BFG48_009190 [Acinetobacter nosocomialis]|nr:hypothetical protein [Acinetobacter nosocomialis]OUJ89156.1 hypothetical protein BFG48_009190 [Acinetobacter nosocomialis]
MISSWSTCHKILHILMFITSFGEQNITYKCCSNFLIHLSLLAVTGLTHKQSYKDIFAVTVIKTLAVFVVITVFTVTGIV